jgi:hypothetical protein
MFIASSKDLEQVTGTQRLKETPRRAALQDVHPEPRPQMLREVRRPCRLVVDHFSAFRCISAIF